MKSAVAGIIDAGGGLRVVIAQPHELQWHVGAGEQLFIVPKLRVKEPVPLHEIPDLVRLVENHVANQLKHP